MNATVEAKAPEAVTQLVLPLDAQPLEPNAETQTAIEESYAGRVEGFESIAAMVADADGLSGCSEQAMWRQPNVRLGQYAQLRVIAWNRRADDEMPEVDALALYEREWRHVDEERMAPEERRFLHRLIEEYGRGAFVPV